MANFVAIDFETANEKRNSACAIGIAIVENGELATTEKHFIKPKELRFSDYLTNFVHGIAESDVTNAPLLSELWPSVWDQIRGKIVVAHNASFDMSVLRNSLYANEVDFPEFDYFCSIALSQSVWPDIASYSLKYIAPKFGITLDHHDPESDAKASAQLVLMALEERSTRCPRELCGRLDVRIGHIYPDGDWQPCSGPARGSRSTKDWLEIDLPPEYQATEHRLYGKNVLITGDLGFCTKENAYEIVELLGGQPMKGFSKKLDVLVSGHQDMSKLAKGEKISSKMKKSLELKESGKAVEIIAAKDFHDCVFDLHASEG